MKKLQSANPSVPSGRLDEFVLTIPNLVQVMKSLRDLVEHFAYFLTEQLGERIVTPRRIRACFDAAAISAPANIADVMRKSNGFIRTKDGYMLSRETKNRIENSLKKGAERVTSLDRPDGTHNIVVVHGRDKAIRDSIFQFLRALSLNPIEWNEAVRRTGHGSPYTGQVVEALLHHAQAIVVVLSPDERVTLRRDLRGPDANDNGGWQPRPNVFVEGGMALSKNEAQTILVQVGSVRIPSDWIGRHLVKLDDSPAQRHSLIQRLVAAGCSACTTGDDWLRAGRFAVRPKVLRG